MEPKITASITNETKQNKGYTKWKGIKGSKETENNILKKRETIE